MALTDEDVTRAEAAMQARMAAGPRAISARYNRSRNRVVISLDNGLELAFPPHLAEGLDKASAADLSTIEITPTGLGLHWPNLDADLWPPALLQGVFGSPGWMAGLARRIRPAARGAAPASTRKAASA
jgi:hypothetical protein